MTSMNLSLESGKRNHLGLLFFGLNQDHGCFACGTESGFTIFNCDPLKERFRREFDNGGIGIVEMLWRCNILALVGGGHNPKYPPNKVMIWDDYQNKCIAELEFRSEVKAVKLRRDKIVVVLRNRIFVYNFSDLQLLDQIDTSENPKGLCALSPDNERTILACPDVEEGRGVVQVKCYETSTPPIHIQAHDSSLAQMALNHDGSLLATCSLKGTLVRVFDTATGNRLCEFRRGADNADIFGITFNLDSTFLCVSSDRGTVHIYKVSSGKDDAVSTDGSGNRQSSLSFMGSLLGGYFNSQWSFSQFHLPVEDPRCLCAFGQTPNSVIAICASGTYYKYIFDPLEGGEAKQEICASFLRGFDD